MTTLTTSMVLLAALSGCADDTTPGGTDKSLTLNAAKATAQEMESELASYVPSESIASIEQRPSGSLLSCDRERGYQWSGRTDVTYRDGASVDPQGLVDAITAAFGNGDGFRTEPAPTIDGQPGVHVFGEFGAGYLVNENTDRTAVQILSFSPCFVLPDGMSPSKQY
nr:hypothetical protein [Microbacterium testaceum]